MPSEYSADHIDLHLDELIKLAGDVKTLHRRCAELHGLIVRGATSFDILEIAHRVRCIKGYHSTITRAAAVVLAGIESWSDKLQEPLKRYGQET